jgi:phosphatidylglycerophosphatase A
MIFRDKVAVLLATGLYVGNIPLAPGTFGSLLGLPLAFFMAGISLPAAIMAGFLIIILAVWISDHAAKVLKRKDPGCIVIDEIAGMMVALFGLPFHLISVITGFVLFRIFDMIKPFPIRMIDRGLTGGLGIVADDVAAGIFANILTRLLLMFLEGY